MIGYAVINKNGSYDIIDGFLIVFKQVDDCYRVYNNIKGDHRIVEAEINEFLKDNDCCYYVKGFRPIKILSEDDIYGYFRINKDSVSWSFISFSQKLLEDFIREFQDKVSWYYIKKYQKLSPKFQEEFKEILSKY